LIPELTPISQKPKIVFVNICDTITRFFLANSFLRTTTALFVGIASSLALSWMAGESPSKVLMIFYQSIFGSAYDFGMCLSYATPLVFTGLSVATVFQLGLFNVGAEGQLAIGALGATYFALHFPNLPWQFALPGAATAGFCTGAAWGFLPGWILAKRGGHEVISTIMLNFVSSALCGYLVLGPLRNSTLSNPETPPVSEAYHLGNWNAVFGDAPVTVSFVIAVTLCLVVWILLNHTTLGLRIRASGQNPNAARTAGYPTKVLQMGVFAFAGGLSGLVALPEIFGNAHRYVLGFSSDLGFTGIAVALLVRSNPLAVIPAALLFGCLQKGALDLEFQSEVVTRDMALVMRAFILLAVILVGTLPYQKGKLSK
jgi:general nucleoside transport system permease protein